MQFKSILLAASLFGAAAAQSIQIGVPVEAAQLKSGSNITVEVDRPNSLTGSAEIALVIGIQSCVSKLCDQFNATDYLGSLLLRTGSYNPQYSPNATFLPPHQNFTVTIPSYLEKGKARLSVSHYSLVGASMFALFETKTVNVTIV